MEARMSFRGCCSCPRWAETEVMTVFVGVATWSSRTLHMLRAAGCLFHWRFSNFTWKLSQFVYSRDVCMSIPRQWLAGPRYPGYYSTGLWRQVRERQPLPCLGHNMSSCTWRPRPGRLSVSCNNLQKCLWTWFFKKNTHEPFLITSLRPSL